MKKVKNHEFFLIANLIITGLLQNNYFSYIGIINVVLTFIYLILIIFLKGINSRYFSIYISYILYFIIIITSIIYYFSKPLFAERNIDTLSLMALSFFILILVFALTLDKVKINFIFGVRTGRTMNNPENWHKVNNFASKSSYLLLLPMFILIIYLDNSTKMYLSILIMIIYILLPLVYDSIIFNKMRRK